MSAFRVLSVLSILLATAVCAPQEIGNSRPSSIHTLSLPSGLTGGFGGGGGGGGSSGGFGRGDSIDLHLPDPPRTFSRPLIPLSGPAGSAGAAAGLAGSAAHSHLGVSGGLKGVGLRVVQSDRVSVGAGLSTNFRGDNAGGFHVAIKF